MGNISEQKIIVICDFSDTMNAVILHGIKLATMLDKELCLFSLFKKKDKKIELQERLSELAKTVKKSAEHLVVSTLILKKSLIEQVENLADKYDSILVITDRSKLSGKIKAVHESTIPFLFIEGKTSDLISYKNVLLPVDFRREMKETSLWASYFGRFNQAIVQVVYAKDKNKRSMAGVKKNLLFIKKFLAKLKVIHVFIKGNSGSWGIQKEAMARSNSGQGDVIIMLGSKHITPIDLMIGLPEKKLTKKAGKLPVLCINPSKDMNILCD